MQSKNQDCMLKVEETMWVYDPPLAVLKMRRAEVLRINL